MPLALIVGLFVLGVIGVMGLIGYLIDQSDTPPEPTGSEPNENLREGNRG
jgi:hypothetical protein